MFGTHYVHEIVVTKKGTVILIDVANTFDAGIEGAYAIFDEEVFREWWNDEREEDDEYYDNWTLDDIKDWGEEEADAFGDWEIVSSHHRSYEAAKKAVLRAIKNL